MTSLLAGAGRASLGACVGDCDGVGKVTVDEPITIVNIARTCSWRAFHHDFVIGIGVPELTPSTPWRTDHAANASGSSGAKADATSAASPLRRDGEVFTIDVGTFLVGGRDRPSRKDADRHVPRGQTVADGQWLS